MFGDVGGLPGITLVGVTDATAQELFAEPGAYDSVVVASDGSVVGRRPVRPHRGHARRRRSRFEVLTGAADTANSKADLKEGLGFFNTFLMAFAYIALFVGMFIIYNTFSIVVAQRARDMAMLRAIGASRAQVVRSVRVRVGGGGRGRLRRRPGRRRAHVVRPAGPAERGRPRDPQRPHRDHRVDGDHRLRRRHRSSPWPRPCGRRCGRAGSSRSPPSGTSPSTCPARRSPAPAPASPSSAWAWRRSRPGSSAPARPSP